MLRSRRSGAGHPQHRTKQLRCDSAAAPRRARDAPARGVALTKGKAAPKIARWRLDVDDGRLCPKGWSTEASR